MIYKITENTQVISKYYNDLHLNSIIDFMKINGINTGIIDLTSPEVAIDNEYEQLYYRVSSNYMSDYRKQSNLIFECDLPVNCDYQVNGFIYSKITDISEITNNTSKTIWSIKYNFKEWNIFDDIFEKLRKKNKGNTLYLDNWITTVNEIRMHPCRIGLCSGCECHSAHSNLPKQLFIDGHGDVYPRGLIHKKYFIGNISDPFCLMNYKNTEPHKRYIALNEWLFYNIAIKSCYTYLPWNDLMEHFYNEDHQFYNNAQL